MYIFSSLCGNNTMLLYSSRILRILINLLNYEDTISAGKLLIMIIIEAKIQSNIIIRGKLE